MGFKKEGRKPDLRINDWIRAREVRVIGPDDAQLGVMPRNEALIKAREADLDLVEIAPLSNPPVCKIVDYGKYKYLQKKKEHDQRRKQPGTHMKEVKFRLCTDEHDLAYKIRNVHRFLVEGHKAKITIRFVGREIVYAGQADVIMKRVADDVKDVGKVDKEPVRVGKTMGMVLAPTGKHKQTQ